MKIDQIAFYCATEAQEQTCKAMFGLTDAEWLRDTVHALSSVRNSPYVESIGELQFNYSLGIELEILRYTKGPHWLELHPQFDVHPFISHIGVHLNEGDSWPVLQPPAIMVQHTVTQYHTNERFHDPSSPMYGRQYEYRIYELGPTAHVKYIKRIQHK